MFKHIKSSCLAISIFILLLSASNVSFARFGAADIQGTWELALKVTFTNVNWAGKPASSKFSDLVTMEITQFVNTGSGSPVRVKITNATNPLLDDIIPPPIFWGKGIVNPAASLGAGKDHMVAVDCDSNVDNFAGQIIVHKIYRVTSEMGFTRMKGTLMIVDNAGGDEAGLIATFIAARLDTDDPGVAACP